jgi:translation initiation factor eIF-2B subunit epsilon
MVITVMVSKTCSSLGDAMRDLDAKAVIRSDFILVSGDMVANVNLLPILEHHRFETNRIIITLNQLVCIIR